MNRSDIIQIRKAFELQPELRSDKNALAEFINKPLAFIEAHWLNIVKLSLMQSQTGMMVIGRRMLA